MEVRVFYQEHYRAILGTASVLALIALWELLLTFVIPLNPFSLPSRRSSASLSRSRSSTARSGTTWP